MIRLLFKAFLLPFYLIPFIGGFIVTLFKIITFPFWLPGKIRHEYHEHFGRHKRRRVPAKRKSVKRSVHSVSKKK